MKNIYRFAIILFLICSNIWSSGQAIEFSTDVFIAGENGYHSYRIPALAVTKKGTVLAFCEGRKLSRRDYGDIDLLLKRSTDNGKTWSDQIVVWDDGSNTCGNPCPVVVSETGRIVLLMTWGLGEDTEQMIIDGTSKDTRRVFITYSDDDGLSWSEPKEITSDVKPKDWSWYATGPGGGIQIEKGKFAGRLVVPCDHIETVTKNYFSHVIISDDNGNSWKLGGRTAEPMVNECQVVELSGGKLMLNMRNYDKALKCRQTAISYDGGLTWDEQKFDSVLIEPRCEASIKGFAWNKDGSRKLVLFSNPADSTRTKMTIRLSYDEAKSWEKSEVLHPGPSAYSDLVVFPGYKAGCLYEGGDNNAYEKIIFVGIDLSKL